MKREGPSRAMRTRNLCRLVSVTASVTVTSLVTVTVTVGPVTVWVGLVTVCVGPVTVWVGPVAVCVGPVTDCVGPVTVTSRSVVLPGVVTVELGRVTTRSLPGPRIVRNQPGEDARVSH